MVLLVLCMFSRCVYVILKSCASVIVVCECFGSGMNMFGVLKNCGSVIVFCEYNGDVVYV